MTIAIIGAGMAGLACAGVLAEAGRELRMFDKGRGPGGRMATRRMDLDGAQVRFDHGAQYFTARDPQFRAQVERWESEGIAARWPAAGDDAFVGAPSMNAPIRAMAEKHGATFGTRIEEIRREGEGYRLHGEGAPDEVFEALVVAVPAEQAGPLLRPLDDGMAELAGQTSSEPCWTLMAAFDGPVPFDEDTMRARGAIGWAARNSAKPGRGDGECWVVQGDPEWSRINLEEDQRDVQERLLALFAEEVGEALPPVRACTAHRWRYAMSGNAGRTFLWDAEKSLGACGDWLKGPRVENAWLSGTRLGEAIRDG